MNERIALIWNPISGRGRATRHAEEAERILAARSPARLTRYPTTKPGDARRFAREASSTHDVILSIGGDGTLNEVMSGVCVDAAADLASTSKGPVILPIRAGTSNIMAMELEIPPAVGEALRLLDEGEVVLADRGQRSDRDSFVLWAGVGFDGEIVRRVMEGRKGPMSKLSYLRPFARAFLSYRLPRLEVRADGELLDGTFGQVLVANARIYAAYLRLSVRAAINSGTMAVIGLRARTRLQLIPPLLSALLRRLDRTEASIRLARRIEVRSLDEPAPLQVDGDFGGFTPLEVEVIPRCVPLLVPRKTAATLKRNEEILHA